MLDWTKYEGRREVVAYPAKFSETRFGIPALWEAVSKAEILYRGWPFIYVDRNRDTRVVDDGLQTEVTLTHIRGHEYFETWRLLRSGLFFHRAVMDEDAYPPLAREGKVLGLETTVYHISEAIGSLWHLYAALGVADTEFVTMTFTYDGVQGRDLRIVSPSRAGFIGKQTCFVPKITCERGLPLGDWRASEVDLATDVCVEIFQQFQWIQPNLTSIRELASGLLGKKR